MNKNSNSTSLQIAAALKRRFATLVLLPLALIAAGIFAGCQSHPITPAEALKGQTGQLTTTTNEAMDLREGDRLQISFPGSPTLDTTQTIRRDGKITMQLVGDVDAAGMTPAALEQKLVDLYASQISSKQVTVQVVSSSLPVYVTGMVMRPGKIVSDHPITALDAIMEAGGPDYTKANLKNVTIIRREGNVIRNYRLNLKDTLRGQPSAPFYLKPNDIIYVPERFSVF
jgi:polysaccharide export outer membrane protein